MSAVPSFPKFPNGIPETALDWQVLTRWFVNVAQQAGGVVPQVGGDLSGELPDPTVTGINGALVPANTSFLGANPAGQLVRSPLAGGDLTGSYPDPRVVAIHGAAVPLSAAFLATNSGGQLIPTSAQPVAQFQAPIATPTIGTVYTLSARGGIVTATIGGTGSVNVISDVSPTPTIQIAGPALAGTVVTFPVLPNYSFKITTALGAPTITLLVVTS